MTAPPRFPMAVPLPITAGWLDGVSLPLRHRTVLNAGDNPALPRRPMPPGTFKRLSDPYDWPMYRQHQREPDLRKWPNNCGYDIMQVLSRAQVKDDDLRWLIIGLDPSPIREPTDGMVLFAGRHWPSDEAVITFGNVFNACVDEQDRRRG